MPISVLDKNGNLKEAVITVTGPTGPAGPQGTVGIQGPPGFDGEDPTDGGVILHPVPLPPTMGGTGQAATAQGDLLYADATNSLARLPKSNTRGFLLSNTGTNNAPVWTDPLTAGTLTIPYRSSPAWTNLSDLSGGTNIIDVGWTHGFTGSGGSQSAVTDTQGSWLRVPTTASANSDFIVLWNQSFSGWSFIDWNPYFSAKIRAGSTITSYRVWVGMFAFGKDPHATDDLGASGIKGYGFRFSTSASDTNWQFAVSDGVTMTLTDSTIPVVASDRYFLTMGVASNAAGCINDTTGLSNPAFAVTYPSISAVNLQPQITVTTLTTAIRSLDIAHVYGEHI